VKASDNIITQLEKKKIQRRFEEGDKNSSGFLIVVAAELPFVT
jgi:hypothetical protein